MEGRMSPLEINKKIATLKGWNSEDLCNGYGGDLPNSPDGWFCDECGFKASWDDGAEDGPHEKPITNYAESISDAWELFEEMSQDEWIYIQYIKDIHWQVRKLDCREWGSAAKTAPLAICHAYITWKEL